MKYFILRNFFSKQTLELFRKSETSREEQTKTAMDYLYAEGKQFRVLPAHYEEFVGSLITGVKGDPDLVETNLRRRVLNTIKPEVSRWYAAYILLAPYFRPDSLLYPEQALYKARQSVHSTLAVPTPMLGYVKILATAIIEQNDRIPYSVASMVATIVYHNSRDFQKEMKIA